MSAMKSDWTRTFKQPLRLLGLALVCTVAWTAEPAQKITPMNEDGWSWPESASNVALRKEIMRQHFTPEERRNVQTTLEEMNGTGRGIDRGRWTAKDFKPPAASRSGFQEMDSAFGRNDYRISSVLNRINTVEDIIAKGDRVVVLFRVTGNLNGPMFTFENIGAPIETREMLVLHFNSEGLGAGICAWGEGFVLYKEIGGQIVLPSAATPAPDPGWKPPLGC
jgi:hypothetical protein